MFPNENKVFLSKKGRSSSHNLKMEIIPFTNSDLDFAKIIKNQKIAKFISVQVENPIPQLFNREKLLLELW